MSIPQEVKDMVDKLDQVTQARLLAHLRNTFHTKALSDAIAFSDSLAAQLRVLDMHEASVKVEEIHDQLLARQTRPNG